MIKAPKIHTDLLWDLSFLFIGLGLVYFIAVFFYRNRLSARGDSIKRRKRELSPMISEFIFHEENDTKEEKSNYIHLKVEIRELLKDNFNRGMLSEILLDLRKDVSGETQYRLLELYQDLGLHNDAFSKLKSWRWQVISKAILDLTQMQVVEAYGFITKFINDKRATIRKQAEIATVTLKHEGLNYFLDTTKYKISEWQQLKLLEVIRNQKDYQPPKFKAWLTSSNGYVVLFALRLIKFYNQNDAKASIIELVKHKNSQIKEEAIACIKEFNITEALDTLKVVFWKSSTDIKIAILDAIGYLGSEKDIEFLQLIKKKESNFAVTSKALSSINAIAPETIMPSKGIQDTSGYRIPEDLPLSADSEQSSEVITETKTDSQNVDGEIVEEINNEVTDSLKPASVLEDESKETITPEGFSMNKAELDRSLSIEFLPIVVRGNQKENSYRPNLVGKPLSIHNLPVIFEEISPSTSPDDRYTFLQETAQDEPLFDELNFLPIVVETRDISSKEVYSTSESRQDRPVHTINVTYESVAPNKIPYDQTSQNSKEESEIDNYFKQYHNPVIFDIVTIYEEVLPPAGVVDLICDMQVIDPCYLSSQPSESEENRMDVKSNVIADNLPSSVEMNPQEEAKFREIINELIDFEKKEDLNEIVNEFEGSPLLEFENELIDISFIPLVSETTNNSDEERIKKKIETTEEKEQKLEGLIPKSVLPEEPMMLEWQPFDEGTEEATMQLLDDLTELGDYREIPLLNEMLTNEKYATIKERIKKLIEQFSVVAIETAAQVKPTSDVSLKAFNIFEDLFRTCDTDAKLILLDEVTAVGDERDLVFLEGLLNDSEEIIQQKAAQVLEEVKTRLAYSETEKVAANAADEKERSETPEEYSSLMEELEIDPSQDDSEIFDIAFEFTYNKDERHENNETTEGLKNSQKSIMGQLCSISNKIIDKLNG